MKEKFILLLLLMAVFTTYGQSSVSPAAQIGGGGGENPPVDIPNTITFDYDTAGNQYQRRIIYIASGVYKNAEDIAIDSTKLIKSDIYLDVSYFPNPVKEELFLKWTNTETVYVKSLQLYNMAGQLLKKVKDLNRIDEVAFSFQPYPQGFYNLMLVYSNDERKTLKIVKQ